MYNLDISVRACVRACVLEITWFIMWKSLL